MVSPRGTSFISGLTRCETEIWVKPCAPRQHLGLELVRRRSIDVQEDDRTGAKARRAGAFQRALERDRVERRDHAAAGIHPLVGLDHALVERLRAARCAASNSRGRACVAIRKRVAKAAGGDEQRALAAPLEQRVGRNGRAHLHGLDLRGRDHLAGAQLEHAANTLDGGIRVVRGVLGEQFQGLQPAIGRTPHDIGECAAAVDPELPAVAASRNQALNTRPRVSGNTQAAAMTRP